MSELDISRALADIYAFVEHGKFVTNWNGEEAGSRFVEIVSGWADDPEGGFSIARWDSAEAAAKAWLADFAQNVQPYSFVTWRMRPEIGQNEKGFAAYARLSVSLSAIPPG